MQSETIQFYTTGAGFMGKDTEQRRKYDEENNLIHEQIKQNELELGQKRDKLANERLNAIKSQGELNWNSSPPTGVKG